MHPRLIDLVFSIAGSLFVVYGAALLAAIWLVPSLKKQILLRPWLWGTLPEGNVAATTQALFYLFFGAYLTLAHLGFHVASFILFVPFVVCAVIRFRQRFNHRSGRGQA